MAEPKYVIAFGVCVSSGGFNQNYSAVLGPSWRQNSKSCLCTRIDSAFRATIGGAVRLASGGCEICNIDDSGLYFGLQCSARRK